MLKAQSRAASCPCATSTPAPSLPVTATVPSRIGNCPEMKEVAVVLSDTDRNGRFDHITVIADQYVAGPYAEGPYDISLPITARMIKRVKPEFAPSFEPRPPVR